MHQDVERISVVGLGKLGSYLATMLGNAGDQVTGINFDELIVDDFNKGTAPFQEPHLTEYIHAAGKNLGSETRCE